MASYVPMKRRGRYGVNTPWAILAIAITLEKSMLILLSLPRN